MATVTAKRSEQDFYPNSLCVRVTLPEPHYDARPHQNNELSTGRFVTQLYSGPKSGRKFAFIVSQWDREDSGYWEVSEATYLEYCELVGVEPINVEPVEV